MATLKRVFVFLTAFLSGIGVLFTVVSLATEQWVFTDKAYMTADDNNQNQYNTIKYGLFQGTLRTYNSLIVVQITMTCLAEENICAVLCAKNATARYDLLKGLYNGTEGIDQNTLDCPQVSKSVKYHNHPISKVYTDSSDVNKKFINCGIWVSTVVFIVLSIAFGIISCILSIYNTVSNPVQVYLSIYGIFIFNALAMVSVIMTLTLWGVFFHLSIYHNVAVFHTLDGSMSSDKTAVLGYSYWILFIPIVFYAGSICLLYIRQVLISRDPKQKIAQMEELGDPRIYLY